MVDVNGSGGLPALIDTVKGLNGWTDTDVARRAQAAGHKLTRSGVQRARHARITRIDGSSIDVWSAALGVPRSTVLEAMIATAGWAPQGSGPTPPRQRLELVLAEVVPDASLRRVVLAAVDAAEQVVRDDAATTRQAGESPAADGGVDMTLPQDLYGLAARGGQGRSQAQRVADLQDEEGEAP